MDGRSPLRTPRFAAPPEPRREAPNDLADFRPAALAFKLATSGARPIAIVQAIDENGDEHCLAVREASHGEHAAYLVLLEDLLRRGLRATRPLLVDVAGCRWLARRVAFAFGPIVPAEAPANAERGDAGRAPVVVVPGSDACSEPVPLPW